ncbi:TonB-dependent receptor [bacterium]|nr:TonB-dependent receptor [bacterium]
MKKLIYLMLLVLFCFANSFAGTTGKIKGRIVDAETNEPLPAVNVVVDGTYMGAATDMAGYYVILNVPPGTYTLRASMMGYATSIYTNVRVKIDLTTDLDFQLGIETLEGQEVEIVAERPLVDVGISASQANVEARTIQALPVQNVEDAIGIQAGVVGLSIRGGGKAETLFMVDGLTMRDERDNAPFTGISLSAIEEIKIQTGGFSAEYGNVRSGIINVVTKEGKRDRYSGAFTINYSTASAKTNGPSGYAADSYWNRPFLDDAVCWTGTDNGAWDEYTQYQYPRFEGWNSVSERTLQDDDLTNDLTPEAAQQVYRYQHRKDGEIRDPDYTIDAGFGGPVPFISEKLGDLRFYLSHRQEQDMYMIPLALDAYSDQSTLLKVTSNITPSMTVQFSGMYAQVNATSDNNVGAPGYLRENWSIANELQRRSYIDAIMYGYDYWCPTHRYRHKYSGKFTHAVSPKTFYEVSLEREGTIYRTRPNALRDTTAAVVIGGTYVLDEAPYGYWPYPSSGINGIRMGVGMSNSRDNSEVYTTTVKLHATSQLNQNNELKAGFDFVYNDHQVEYGAIELTLPAGRPWSVWSKNPIRMGAYLEDKLEFKGLIANLGVRFDYSHAGDDWYAVDEFNREFYSSEYSENIDDLIPKEETERKYYLSPRLGISHPITENSKFYFNYGHFRSMPSAERLYLVRRVTEGFVSYIGNPNNDLQKTVAYELGYEHNLFDQFLLHFSAFYRDITTQPNWVQYLSADSKVNYRLADDNYYEDVRGYEISLQGDRMLNGWLTAIMNYTYTVSSNGYFGSLKYFENPAEQREYDRDNIYQEKPVPRPYFKGNAIVKSPLDFGPEVWGKNPFGDINMSLSFLWRRGRYVTWTRGVYIPGIEYNIKRPNYHNLDLRVSKAFNFKKFSVELFMDHHNLYDAKVFSNYGFSDGTDYRNYMDSLLWPKNIGDPLGYREFGDDEIGDLRPSGVAYDRLESNPNNDSDISARNEKRRDSKSYIDNPNLEWLYYLNPRDVFFGVKFNF